MKERMLTVLVPIKDSDATVVTSLPAVTPDNINVIYKHEGVYKRIWLNPATNQYEYHEVIDREFPYLGKPLEIFDFTYDATRMGTAPTISAQNIMWYADRDANNKEVTLERLWSQECHVVFNGENYYLKQIPTAGKSNEDARYKYDIDFVNERVVLEQVYLYDVVQPFITERPVSESTKFSFFGDINELIKRINTSLLRSKLAEIALNDGVSESDILSYSEWNSIGLGTYDGPIEKTRKYIGGQGATVYRYFYPYYDGDYNAYLRGEIYKIVDGDFVITGYQCKIGKNAKGEMTTSEEKLIVFEDDYIHEALQQVHDTFGLQYYIVKEKNGEGEFTGNTFIVIGDCEYDFADLNEEGTDYIRDDEGLPTTTHPFDYGVDDALLSKEKTNTTDKIITRITGTGSEENIPWYYPNPTADGWIKPLFKENGEVQNIEVDYPQTEGTTVPDGVKYEKYLKNRIGDIFQYGVKKGILRQTSYKSSLSGETGGTNNTIQVVYVLNVKTGFVNPKFQFSLSFLNGSNLSYFQVRLRDNTASEIVGEYDSSQSYANPTDFQRAFIARDGSVILDMVEGHIYYLYFGIHINGYMPLSRKYDYSGHFYPIQDIEVSSGVVLSVPSDFYNSDGLLPAIHYSSGTVIWAGYSYDGTKDTKAEPLKRFVNMKYKDVDTGSIYLCTASERPDYNTGARYNAYFINPRMHYQEWVETFMRLSIGLWSTDGWYRNSKKVNLADYALTLGTLGSHTLNVTDTIEFQRLKYLTPQATLMPEVYVKTDGERRFYDAVNYPLPNGNPDPAIGETEVDGQIVNPLYYKDDTHTHYDFENEIMPKIPLEHIEEFKDIKPTIKEQTNYIRVNRKPADWDENYNSYYTKDNNGVFIPNTNPVFPPISRKTKIYKLVRIDIVEMFAYDDLDNDEIWENNDNGNVSGEYKHPYFFAKLRPLGFNIFDLALQDDMVLSMTTGHCGACNFKIGVDENTKKNPVQIWEYDVYQGADYSSKTLKYTAGELRRYVDTTNLYYDTTPDDESGYIHINTSVNILRGGFIVDASSRQQLYQRAVYPSEQVVNGEVGSLKQEGKMHTDGDVVTSGKFIESQQDTSENFVWVALMKDTDSYGVIMPSARPDYADDNYSVYIRPASFSDTGNEDTADKFVLTNIRLPQTYLRRAERELSETLIKFMYDGNYQKFNYSIKNSRIFLAQNAAVDDRLNENSVIYVSFDNKIYRQYVKHYTYRMTKDVVLPEISVDMNEELSVSRTKNELERDRQRLITASRDSQMNITIERWTEKMNKMYVKKNADTIVSGNLVSMDAVTSFMDLNSKNQIIEANVRDNQEEISTGQTRFASFVDVVNTFNNGVDERLKQIRLTVENRLLPTAKDVQINTNCQGVYQYQFEPRVPASRSMAKLWLDANGDDQIFSTSISLCPTDHGMTDINWTNFDIN